MPECASEQSTFVGESHDGQTERWDTRSLKSALHAYGMNTYKVEPPPPPPTSWIMHGETAQPLSSLITNTHAPRKVFPFATYRI